MKKIGISQRVDCISGRDECRDALDVRWAEFMWSLGFLPIILSSRIVDVDTYLNALGLEGLILSGGNDVGSAPDRDRLETAILDYSLTNHLPVLGVCRGMHFINLYLGGGLAKCDSHVAVRHKLLGSWVMDKGYTEVNSYHNLAIMPELLGKQLEVLAISNDGVIEAFAHRDFNWLGIMWHPERELPFSQIDKHVISEHFA